MKKTRIKIIRTDNTAGLMRLIRELVNHPRLHPRFYPSKQFNRLCSAMDVIDDVELIISSYEARQFASSLGATYLTIYGLFQALYVQSNAVRELAKAIGCHLRKNDAVEMVRSVRAQAVGHPTSHDKITDEGFSFITQHNISPWSFELDRYTSSGRTYHERINLLELLETHKDATASQLYEIFSCLLMQFATEGEEIPRHVLSRWFANVDDCLKELKSMLQGSRNCEKAPIKSLRGKFVGFRTDLMNLNLTGLLSKEHKSVLTKLNFIEWYLFKANSPTVAHTHRVYHDLDGLQKLFDDLFQLSRRLEGDQDPDEVPWIDISLRNGISTDIKNSNRSAIRKRIKRIH